MLKKILIISAVLTGLAVPSQAQGGVRARHGGGVELGAQRRQNARHVGVSARLSTRSSRRSNYTRQRSRGHGHDVHAPRFRVERVWVPGHVHRIHVPAEYAYEYDTWGNRIRVLVRDAWYRTVREPGHWEYRRVMVHTHSRRHFHY